MSTFAQTDLESLLKQEGRSWERKIEFLGKKATGLGYDVKYHRIELHIDPEIDTMSGAVTTYFTSSVPQLDLVQFDLRNNLIVDSVTQGVSTLVHRRVGDLVEIDLPTGISDGSLDSVTIHYHGDPTDNPYRSYVREPRRPKSDHPVIWTLSEPYGAHAWWPCKEGLNDKIDSLDIIVTVPNGNKVASNGWLVDTTRIGDDQIRFTWKHRYPIVTYLVAFCVSDYTVFTDMVYRPDGDSVPVVNYLFPEYVPGGREPAKETVKMMNLFDSLFGYYPFSEEKYGHAQMLESGGMEHQTMSFMSGLDYGLVAHELAHQWFGDLITCGSWSDLWLNEGFATYLTYLAKVELLGANEGRSELESIRRRAMSENNGSVFVADTLNRQRLFSGRLTYAKAGLLLHMLRWEMGDDAFFDALRNYLNDPRLRFGTARTSDLQSHLEATSGLDLTEFFADWFYGEGYPSYIVRWTRNGHQVEVELDQNSNTDVEHYDVTLPLKFYGEGRDTVVRLESTTNQSSHSLILDFVPDSLDFDPDLHIIAKAQIFQNEDIIRNLGLFPNPGSGVVNVIHNFSDVESVELVSLDGKMLFSPTWKDLGSKMLQIDLSSLSNGLYIISVKGNNGTMRAEFLKTSD